MRRRFHGATDGATARGAICGTQAPTVSERARSTGAGRFAGTNARRPKARNRGSPVRAWPTSLTTKYRRPGAPDLWSLIRSTPALDWFLLTKRPQNIRDMLPGDWGDGWPHVWLGTTTENQEEANRRIPHLVTIRAAVRFLSVEPMIEPVDIAPWLVRPPHDTRAPISWIIVGGESGGGARPMHPDWLEASATKCTPAAPSSSSSRSAAITCFGEVSPARAKTRHNGRSICGCRNCRNKVLPADPAGSISSPATKPIRYFRV